MPNYKKKSAPNRISDKTSLGHDAGNPQERFDALQWCLANDWSGLDLGRVERRDTTSFHGWLMWPYVA